MLKKHAKDILKEGRTHFLPEDLNGTFNNVQEIFCAFSEELEFNVNEPSYEFLERRMDFLDEEVEELRVGISEKDDQEILDGAIDVMFIAMTQAYQLFRMRGITPEISVLCVLEAMSEVGYTNLLKNIPLKKGDKITKPEGWCAPKFEVLKINQDTENNG